jgi:zinc-finger of a C2HC-type
MSLNISRGTPVPMINSDQFPCPQCYKMLVPEEFNYHLKTCNSFPDEDSLTDRLPSYTVMSYHDDVRVLCKSCGRKFMPERIAKHMVVCENLMKKRPTFDITKKIFPNLESEASHGFKSKKKIKFSKEFEDKLWYKQHKDFINNMRFARKLVEVEEKGISTIGLKAPVTLAEELIECSTCHRKFAPIPAERHIPRCKDIIHKPKPPPLYREPSTKFPSINKSKMKEMLLDQVATNDIEMSITPNFSKKGLEGKSPSPNSTINYGKNTKKVVEEGRNSLKESKLYVKCPHCRKSLKQSNLKKHLLTCKHFSHHGIFLSQERGHKSKCPNCDYTLVPKAIYCMMCGIKVFDD